jgi:DNA-binding NtrC family response regulator
MDKPLVLVIDDEKNIREALKSGLKMEGFEVYASEDGADGLEKLKTIGADAVVLDLKMPVLGGLDFLKAAHNLGSEAPILVLTGHGGVDEAVETMKRGAYDFLTKPVNLDKLSILLKRSIEETRLKKRQEQLEEMLDERYGFPNIIGTSKAFMKVLQIVKQVAPTDAAVLITGDSGTGKEVIANSIHMNSKRRDGPYIKVHCAALPETLLESELFGHEKGAFTGAISRKKGRFELSDGGTIFLDEIGEISPNMQVKLLRVLQEQEFERVGGEETIKVNIRLITATNKNLKKLTAESKFREDLYYRLNIVNIYLPPLKERLGDIPIFSEYFINYYSHKHERKIKGLTPKALKYFENYTWPGNVRELQNLIENLVVLCDKEYISEDMLPDYITGIPAGKNIVIDIGTTMQEIEKSAIMATLDYTGRNKSRAAKILNIGRKTLLRKLEEYGEPAEE